MRESVEKVLNEKIKPGLQRDGGDIELIDVTEDGVVKVKLRGACACCPGAQHTLQMGVERILKEALPQVKKVEAV
jgi:Fe-S cluster biogenesis protein NfuA